MSRETKPLIIADFWSHFGARFPFGARFSVSASPVTSTIMVLDVENQMVPAWRQGTTVGPGHLFVADLEPTLPLPHRFTYVMLTAEGQFRAGNHLQPPGPLIQMEALPRPEATPQAGGTDGAQG